jgi:hypothetical protein
VYLAGPVDVGFIAALLDAYLALHMGAIEELRSAKFRRSIAVHRDYQSLATLNCGIGKRNQLGTSLRAIVGSIVGAVGLGLLASAANAGSTTVYSESFAGCSSAGFTLSGLWQPVTLGDCSLGEPGCGLYFGDDFFCDYDTGFAVAGSAISPMIDLSSVTGPITLTFDYRLETEVSPCTYDQVRVLVSDDGFATSTQLADNGCTGPAFLLDGAGWQGASIDLSAWADSSVQVRFQFNSVDSFGNGFFGIAVTNVVVQGDPLATSASLSLENPGCQDDVLPGVPGHQIAVELWMRDAFGGGATGFQAFVEFDDASIAYRDDLSSYEASPFPLHILNFGAAPPFNILWAPGRLRLDGSSAPLDPAAVGDFRLATLIFDVLDECASTEVTFGGFPAPPSFFSELSLFGDPISTDLVATGSIDLDDTAPFITCSPDITVAADVSVPLCIGSNCCSSNLGLGCSDADCTTTVCTQDSFCCAVQWDALCADQAVSLCSAVTAPCLGATVNFVVTGGDGCSATTIVCTPPSGSFFSIGTTPVLCTATDECGNVTSCSFNVTVTPTNLILVEVEALVGSFTAPNAVRCIHFRTDSCSVTANETLALTDNGFGFQVSGPVFVEVDCGDWSSLCVKDQQHTKWTTVSLIDAGSYWAAAAPAVLLPGDNDNDGDVDINDVTWLIFTYSSAAAANPCPFIFPGVGPRDADFSLNGVVSGEDYSLLSDQFLTISSCACTLPSEAPTEGMDRRRALPIDEIDARIRNEVDLNKDGVFDADDVLIFEVERGFAPSLSNRMRGLDSAPARRTGTGTR